MFEALPQNCLFNLGAADLSALLYAGHEAAIHIEIVATQIYVAIVAMSESLEVCQFSSTEAISTHCYNVSASN